MRKPAEIEADYKRIHQEGQEVATLIKDLESRLEAAQKRHAEIYGGFVQYGQKGGALGQLKREWEASKKHEADAALPRVRFGYAPYWDEYVVRRVTQKQIRISKQGEDRETVCDRGTGRGGYGNIHPDDLKRILEVDNA